MKHLFLFICSCEQDSNLMGSDFNNTDSSIPDTTRYYATLYVFKFYNSDDIFFACDVTVCPSGSSSCDIVSISYPNHKIRHNFVCNLPVLQGCEIIIYCCPRTSKLSKSTFPTKIYLPKN